MAKVTILVGAQGVNLVGAPGADFKIAGLYLTVYDVLNIVVYLNAWGTRF